MKKMSLFVLGLFLCADLIASASYNQQNQADEGQHNSLDDLRQKIMALENELASIRNRMFSDPNYVYNPGDIDYAMKLSKQIKDLEQEIEIQEADHAAIPEQSQALDEMNSWDVIQNSKMQNSSFSRGDDISSSRGGESPALNGGFGDRNSRVPSSSSDNWEVISNDGDPRHISEEGDGSPVRIRR
jgi:hypothetical protein